MVEKTCVLAVDTSGSVQQSQLYWNKIAELLKKLTADAAYTNHVYIAWSDIFENISLDKLQSHIENQYGNMGTNPTTVWQCLHGLKLSNFDLHLTTDGQIYGSEYHSYCAEYAKLNIKPAKITMYYIGWLYDMNMQFLDCFPEVDYEICGMEADGQLVNYTSRKIGKNYLLNQLCEMDEFKQIQSQSIAIDDETAITNVLEKLYKALYRKMAEYSESELNEGGVGVEFKKFVDLINKYVHCNYIDKNTQVADAPIFDDLFDDYHLHSAKIFDIFVRKFEAATLIDYRKVLSQIIELGNGQAKVDRRLEAYGESWHARATNNMGAGSTISDDDEETADNDDGDDNNLGPSIQSNASCPILMLDSAEYSKFCVVWIGVDDSFGGANHKSFFDLTVRRKLAKNTMRLYEYLSSEQLNQRIPPANQHISIDAFIGLQQLNDVNMVGVERFKRIYESPLHRVNCFGLILYNADTAHQWPTAKMTENEKNILVHNYATIAQLLFGDSEFVGSFALLHTFFMNILCNCSAIDAYLRACIIETIKRSSSISKCNLMIESGLEPKITTSIKNSIVFHAAIYPNEIDKLERQVAGIHAMNIPRRSIQYSSGFLALAANVFDVAYTVDYKRKLALWRFWNYMVCIENMGKEHRSLHIKQIALTKIQNWQRLDENDDGSSHVKVIFLEGRSDGAYFDYLNGIDFDDLAKLIVLFERMDVKTLTANIATDDIELDRNGVDEWYNIKVTEKIPEMSCNMLNVVFCKARCGYPIVCPFTKLPQIECYEKQKFDFNDYFGYTKNSTMLHAHSYVQRCKELILTKSANESHMQFPTVHELKKYIVKMVPLATYHGNIECELKKIIEKHQSWNEWYTNADENEKKKYLDSGSDWKYILKCRSKDENIQKRLENCDCTAHRIEQEQK